MLDVVATLWLVTLAMARPRRACSARDGFQYLDRVQVDTHAPSVYAPVHQPHVALPRREFRQHAVRLALGAHVSDAIGRQRLELAQVGLAPPHQGGWCCGGRAMRIISAWAVLSLRTLRPRASPRVEQPGGEAVVERAGHGAGPLIVRGDRPVMSWPKYIHEQRKLKLIIMRNDRVTRVDVGDDLRRTGCAREPGRDRATVNRPAHHGDLGIRVLGVAPSTRLAKVFGGSCLSVDIEPGQRDQLHGVDPGGGLYPGWCFGVPWLLSPWMRSDTRADVTPSAWAMMCSGMVGRILMSRSILARRAGVIGLDGIEVARSRT